MSETTETYSTDFIANQYNNRIDWIKVFTIIYNLGSTLNSRKLRFFKSDIIEHSLELCSNRNSIIWVDDIGRDLHDSELDIDIEVKYSNNCMYTKSNKPKKTVSLKIKNSLGKQKSNVIKDPADIYMILQQNAVGIISYKDLEPYLENSGDGIQAKIPFGKITIINTKLEMSFEVVECRGFKDEIDRARINYINNIINSIMEKNKKE